MKIDAIISIFYTLIKIKLALKFIKIKQKII